MLEVRNVDHHFGRVQVLHDLNFTVNSGEILGFLGPNGAGKSTTMRIITGYLSPSNGQVLFEDTDVRQNPVAYRRRLGYLPENVPIYPELGVREYLHWVAKIKRSANPKVQAEEVIERCGLGGMSHKLVRHLSKGYKQRLGLAQAILGETRLLILDEPTVGLDPAQIREIRALIKELGKEKTIILSTHILPEVELTCDRVLIINDGVLVAEDTPENLVYRFGGRGRYVMRLAIDQALAPKVAEALNAHSLVNGVEIQTGHAAGLGFIIETDPQQECRSDLSQLAFANGWPLVEFKPADVTLEEAFVHLVHDDLGHTSDNSVSQEVAA